MLNSLIKTLMSLSLVFIFIFSTMLFAQAPRMQWHKGYGTNNGEHIHEIMQTSDGGYIGIGQTSESGRDCSDILVVKIDSSGAFQWQRICPPGS